MNNKILKLIIGSFIFFCFALSFNSCKKQRGECVCETLYEGEMVSRTVSGGDSDLKGQKKHCESTELYKKDGYESACTYTIEDK